MVKALHVNKNLLHMLKEVFDDLSILFLDIYSLLTFTQSVDKIHIPKWAVWNKQTEIEKSPKWLDIVVSPLPSVV